MLSIQDLASSGTTQDSYYPARKERTRNGKQPEVRKGSKVRYLKMQSLASQASYTGPTFAAISND